MPICSRKKIIFIHIPKTGGQSIEKAFDCYDLYENEQAHYPASKVNELKADVYDSYFKFSIVRNPFDKLVSSYRYQVKGDDFRLVDCDKNSSFKEFILKLGEKFADFPQIPWIEKSHYVEQHKFLYSGPRLLVDRVFRFEDFSTEINDFVVKMTGVPVPHINKSRQDHYRGYFDLETRNIVENFYYKDLKVFGYDY